MEGFSYHNIFDTKGIEYLVIIGFLILLVPFIYFLNRSVNIRKQLHRIGTILTAGILKIPQGIHHSEGHTWAHLAKSGIASVGLDDLLLHITGEVKIRYHRNDGDAIRKGDLLAEIIHQDRSLKIFSPISGKIENINEALIASPQALNVDPYHSGWICRIKPSDWKTDTQSYYLAESATEWSQRELLRFKDFLASSLPKHSPEAAMVTMQDGGELRDHVLSELPEGVWKDFQDEFMDPLKKR